jgi:hypothetical protein
MEVPLIVRVAVLLVDQLLIRRHDLEQPTRNDHDELRACARYRDVQAFGAEDEFGFGQCELGVGNGVADK